MRVPSLMLFCLMSLPWCAGAAAPPADPAGTNAAAGPVRLRVVAANLTSGRLQSYDPGHGARILQALKPDIVLIQEFRSGDNSERDIAAWVRAVFGGSFHHYREDGELPNGVISRFPILDRGEWDYPEQVNRDFAWARLDVPGSVDVWAVSVHLAASSLPKRLRSADALMREVRRAVPRDAYLVIGGDLNTQGSRETTLSRLQALVDTTSTAPADEAGNPNTNRNRNKPYDWVLVSPNLQARAVPVPLGGNAGGLVFDSRVYSDLTRVPPVLRDDSAAENMQHMAVVRDFMLP